MESAAVTREERRRWRRRSTGERPRKNPHTLCSQLKESMYKFASLYDVRLLVVKTAYCKRAPTSWTEPSAAFADMGAMVSEMRTFP